MLAMENLGGFHQRDTFATWHPPQVDTIFGESLLVDKHSNFQY